MQLPSPERRDLRLWWLFPPGLFWVWFVTHRGADWGVDIWMYLSVGKEVLQHGIPSKLVFTFGDAAEMPYFAYEWFSSIVFVTAQWAGGTVGLEVLRYGLAGALFLALYHLYNAIAQNRISALLIAGVVIGLASMRLKLRAELFGYICFVATLCCLVRYRVSSRLRDLVCTLPIMLVWVNSHGSYLLGFLLPPLYWISTLIDVFSRASFKVADIGWDEIVHTSRPYLLIWLGVLVCGLCNPYGIKLWNHSFALSSDPFIPTIVNEWKPTLSFLGHAVLTPYFSMVALVALAAMLSFRRLPFHSWVLLAAFGILSLSAVRHIYLFMFVSGAILAEAARGRFDYGRWPWGLYGASLATLVFMVSPVFLEAGDPSAVFKGPVRQRRTLSRRSVQFIETSGMEGPVINSYGLGNYLVYSLYPRISVSMDSRIDAYGRRLFEQNQAALDGAPEVFPDPPKHLIVNPTHARRLAEIGFLRKNPDWRLVYRDASVTIYSRDRSLWSDS